MIQALSNIFPLYYLTQIIEFVNISTVDSQLSEHNFDDLCSLHLSFFIFHCKLWKTIQRMTDRYRCVGIERFLVNEKVFKIITYKIKISSSYRCLKLKREMRSSFYHSPKKCEDFKRELSMHALWLYDPKLSFRRFTTICYWLQMQFLLLVNFNELFKCPKRTLVIA